MYDITNIESFLHVREWMEDIRVGSLSLLEFLKFKQNCLNLNFDFDRML